MPKLTGSHESVDLEAMRAAGFTADEAWLAVRAAHIIGASRHWSGELELHDPAAWQPLYDQARSRFPKRRAIMRDSFAWNADRAAEYAEAFAEYPNPEPLLQLFELALTEPDLDMQRLRERAWEIGLAKTIGETDRGFGFDTERWSAQQLTELYANGQICRAELKRTFFALTALFSASASTVEISPRVVFAHLAAYSQKVPDGDLREPLTITAICGADLVTYLLRNNDPVAWENFPSEQVRRFLINYEDVFVSCLKGNVRSVFYHHKEFPNFVAMLGRAGRVPPKIVTMIVRLAIRGPQRIQPQSRKLLTHVPEWQSHVVNTMKAGKAAERKLAAECILALPDARFTQPLQAALSGRLAASAAPAVMSAYVAVLADRGGTIDQADVERFAQHIKKLPKALAELPLEELPQLAWRTGEPVSEVVQRWLLVTLITEKSPVPTAILRQAFVQICPVSTSAFAQSATSLWLERDVILNTPEQAQQAAAQKLPDLYDMWKTEFNGPDKTRAEVHEELRELELRRPAGSAMSWIGLLSVVALCDDDQVVAEISKYLHQWYHRSAQCQFFVGVLAARGDEPALAALVDLKQRNKSAKLRQVATKVLDQAAKELGVSYVEVALRAMPHFDLTLNGTRTFTEGDKTYTATLTKPGKFAFTNPAGKAVQELPWPWARQLVTRMRATSNRVKPLVTQLWRDAIATGRQWTAEEWSAMFLCHPLLVGFAARSVWQEVLPDGGIRSFRPAGDGSFTDSADEDVPAPAGAVRLAYGTTLSAAERVAWQELFADYGLQPVVNQCGVEPVVLGDAQQTHFADFVGCMMHQRGFKSQARKLGYLAESEMERYVEHWCRELPGREHTVVLRTTLFDSYMPEDKAVALRDAYIAPAGDLDTSLRLSELPAALVTQVHADYQLLGNSSTGFDPEWQKKTL